MNVTNQISNATLFNRYPEIFLEIKQILNEKKIKILSFGCSTGEECNSLSLYFPEASITGYDVCENIIKNNVVNNKNISYVSDCNELLSQKYDIIFCMSVLCIWPEKIGEYKMKQFDDTLNDIDKILNIGGYLCIYNSKFLFSDSAIYNKYKPIETNYKYTSFVIKYSKNKIITDYKHYLFLKNN